MRTTVSESRAIHVRLDADLRAALAEHARLTGAESLSEAARTAIRAGLGRIPTDRRGGFAAGYREGRTAAFGAVLRAVQSAIAGVAGGPGAADGGDPK